MKHIRTSRRWGALAAVLLCAVGAAFWQWQALARMAIVAGLQTFSRSYAASGSGQAIANAMQSAGGDLSKRFRQIGVNDERSQRDLDTQLRTVETDRDALYRSIVAQVKAEALTYARQRGLGRVVFVSAPPKAGRLDLTAQIAVRLSRGI